MCVSVCVSVCKVCGFNCEVLIIANCEDNYKNKIIKFANYAVLY